MNIFYYLKIYNFLAYYRFKLEKFKYITHYKKITFDPITKKIKLLTS